MMLVYWYSPPPLPLVCHVAHTTCNSSITSVMSLFQFGVRCISSSQEQNIVGESRTLPSHVPTLAESSLGRVEFDAIFAKGVRELTDPASKGRKMRGKYEHYTPEQYASIGKYAFEMAMKESGVIFNHFPQLN